MALLAKNEAHLSIFRAKLTNLRIPGHELDRSIMFGKIKGVRRCTIRMG